MWNQTPLPKICMNFYFPSQKTREKRIYRNATKLCVLTEQIYAFYTMAVISIFVLHKFQIKFKKVRERERRNGVNSTHVESFKLCTES